MLNESKIVEKILKKLDESGPYTITINELHKTVGTSKLKFNDSFKLQVDAVIIDLIRINVIRLQSPPNEVKEAMEVDRPMTKDISTKFDRLICNLDPKNGFTLLNQIKTRQDLNALNKSIVKFQKSNSKDAWILIALTAVIGALTIGVYLSELHILH
jgi:hypothetical protein